MRLGIALACALWLAPLLARAQAAGEPAPAKPPVTLDRVVKEQLATDEASRASQERINQLDDESQKLLSEYRRAIADAESYTIYAKQLEAQVASQNVEMNAMQQQLVEVETTSREVAPLMVRMLSTLKEFVALDVPFLLEERRDRVAKLAQMMDRADVTISEKFRRIVEAYQVEMDYGRTIEAYEAKLGDTGDARTVQFLRVGRAALLYQTLDGKETGYWDAHDRKWVVDDDYRHSFKEGIAVARKTRAPEMLIIPIPAPKEAKS
jgi:hypothetical protein